MKETPDEVVFDYPWTLLWIFCAIIVGGWIVGVVALFDRLTVGEIIMTCPIVNPAGWLLLGFALTMERAIINGDGVIKQRLLSHRLIAWNEIDHVEMTGRGRSRLPLLHLRDETTVQLNIVGRRADAVEQAILKHLGDAPAAV